MSLSQDMLEQNVAFLVLRYAIPSIVGMLSTALYIVLDGIFIGRFVGAEGLASVHIVMPAFSFVAALGLMVSIGGGTVISIELGRRNPEQARLWFSMVLTVLIAVWAGSVLAVILRGEQVAIFLGADLTLIPGVLQYMRPLAYFSLPFIGNFFLDYILRATGHPRKAMAIMVGASVLNIALDALMIGVLGWGVRGAAYATGIAQLTGLCAMLLILVYHVKTFSLVPAWPKRRMLSRSLYNGSSEFFTEMSYGLSTLFFNRTLMRIIGVAGVSAYSIVNYINVLVAFVIIGLSMSLQPLISVNLGAGKHRRVRTILLVGYLYSLGFGLSTLALVYFNGAFLVSLFTVGNPALQAMALNALQIIALSYFFKCINIVSSGFFTAIEWAGTSVIISVSRGFVFILVGLIVLPRFFDLQGVWMTMPFAELLTTFLSLTLIVHFFRNRTLIQDHTAMTHYTDPKG